MLPKGDRLYEDLNSEFIQIDRLLDELAEKEFGGYLRFEGDDSEGFIFFENGVPSKSKIERGGEERIVKDFTIVRDIIEDEKHIINIVECDELGTEIIRKQLDGEPLHENLNTEYIDLQSFLSDLTDQELNCYITMEGDGVTGAISMERGIPSTAAFEGENKELLGTDALDRLLHNAGDSNMILNVYKVPKLEEADNMGGEEQDQDEDENDEDMGQLESIKDEFEGKSDDMLEDMGLEHMDEK